MSVVEDFTFQPAATGSRLAATWPLVALAAWTLLVWGGRIRNVVESEFSGVAFIWRFVVAVGFVTWAVAVAVVVLRGRTIAWPLGVGLAAVGSCWWAIRGTGILMADYDLGFKVVHTVLAVVTIGLSWLVMRRRSLPPAVATGPA